MHPWSGSMVRLFLVLAVLVFPWFGAAGPCLDWACGGAVPGAGAQEHELGVEAAQGQEDSGRAAALQDLGPTEDGAVPRAEESTLGLIEARSDVRPWVGYVDEDRPEGPKVGPWAETEWCERARGPPRAAA